MSSPIQRGCLVLADISGYTSYLAGVELDHAHEILTDLLETILDCFQPVLTISKLEGDAVFAYGPDTSLPRGEVLLEFVESTYAAFWDRRQAIRNRTTCTCQACRNIPALDLKFIVHHGDYLLQRVGSIVEAIGSDVNLAHRLMKNNVAGSTGWRAYALYTDQLLAHLGLVLPEARRLVESYDHLGDVSFRCVDLEARYQQLIQARRVFLSREDADRVLEWDFVSPLYQVWDWFTDSGRRSQWQHADIVPVLRIGGRTESGARNHCVHGRKEVVVEDILDIRPFSYFTIDQRPQGSPLSLRLTLQFSPVSAGGTHLTLTARVYSRGFPRWAERLITNYVVDTTLRRRWAFGRVDSLIQSATL